MRIRDFLSVIDDNVKLFVLCKTSENALPVFKYEFNKLEESIYRDNPYNNKILDLNIEHISSPRDTNCFWITVRE